MKCNTYYNLHQCTQRSPFSNTEFRSHIGVLQLPHAYHEVLNYNIPLCLSRTGTWSYAPYKHYNIFVQIGDFRKKKERIMPEKVLPEKFY